MLHDADPAYAVEYSRRVDGFKHVGRWFRVAEFACKDGTDRIVIHPQLVQLLDAIRDKVGAPVKINSGYRTRTYNTKIGGAAKSQHVLGMAADIVVAGKTPKEIAAIAAELKAGGIGIYPTFTHVDVGPVRRWTA